MTTRTLCVTSGMLTVAVKYHWRRSPIRIALRSTAGTEAASSLAANRQLIVELLPTAHRRASRFPSRQDIVEIRGGGQCCSRHWGARLLPFFRCLLPHVSANDYMRNHTNGREKQALRCPILHESVSIA